MMFSPESCQAIVEMGNKEFNKLKKSRVQWSSCLHYVFKGTITRSRWKHIRSNQEVIRRIRKAFDVFKMLLFRVSHPNSRGYKHGSQLWQQYHHKANGALRAATRKKDRTVANFWDRWENYLKYEKHSKAIGWTDAFVRYLDHIVQIDISHEAPAEQRCRYSNLVYLRGMEQYFTKERELPTSSSSSQWSSTSWWSSHEWSSLERMATTQLAGW